MLRSDHEEGTILSNTGGRCSQNNSINLNNIVNDIVKISHHSIPFLPLLKRFHTHILRCELLFLLNRASCLSSFEVAITEREHDTQSREPFIQLQVGKPGWLGENSVFTINTRYSHLNYGLGFTLIKVTGIIWTHPFYLSNLKGKRRNKITHHFKKGKENKTKHKVGKIKSVTFGCRPIVLFPRTFRNTRWALRPLAERGPLETALVRAAVYSPIAYFHT